MEVWIKWCNENQGFVTAILSLVLVLLTLAYVITTVVIAWLNHRNIKISEGSLALLTESEKKRVRPYVVFNIFSENQTAYSTIKNYGRTVATDISVTITPTLNRVFVDGDSESALTAETTSFIPPDYEIKDSLGGSPDFYRIYPDTVFNGEISYKDTQGNDYKETFSISLSSVKKRLYKRETSVSESLVRMADEMEEIKESVLSLLDK